MRALTLAAALLVAFAPGATACSLAQQWLWQGDLDGDTLVTALNQDGVVIDLATGTQTTLTEGYFPDFRAAGDRLYHAGQYGDLGADCSGDTVLEVFNSLGVRVHSADGVDAFDADGDHFVTVRGNTIEVRTGGTQSLVASWTYDRGTSSGPFGGGPAVAVAWNDDRQQVAVSDASGDVLVMDTTGQVLETHDVGGPPRLHLDWHGETLVVAAAEGTTTTFHLLDQDFRTLTLTSGQDYAEAGIATGDLLLLRHGNQVVHVDGVATRLLTVPAGHFVNALAGDADGAVLLVVEKESYGGGEPVGLQRLSDSGFGIWRDHSTTEAWPLGTNPGFAWQTSGPPVAMESGGTPGTGGPDGEGAPEVNTTPMGAALLPVALLGALLLARQRSSPGAGRNRR